MCVEKLRQTGMEDKTIKTAITTFFKPIYATLSIQNGDDIKTVSENMGHATVAFTLDVYGHVTEQMRSSSAERMERLIKSL